VADPPASVVEPVIALMTKTPEVEPEPPESPESPPDESTSLWLEPAFEFFKSFCSLQEEIAAMKNKIRILKGHLLFKVLRIFILI
jgi:hypothetical protein